MMPTQSIRPQADLVSRSRALTKPGLYSILPRSSRIESIFPNFHDVDVQVLATPALGARFIQCELILKPGGGSVRSLTDGLEQFFFILEGELEMEAEGELYPLIQGSFAWLPPQAALQIHNRSQEKSRVLWLRKRYQAAEGIKPPEILIAHERDIPESRYQDSLSNTEKYLIPHYTDPAFDMGMVLMIFEPGHQFDFAESHINEHGLYMYEGCGVYWLNGDFHETEAGDFIYMAPFCPQFFYATGWSRSSYILYKEVNRDYISDL